MVPGASAADIWYKREGQLLEGPSRWAGTGSMGFSFLLCPVQAWAGLCLQELSFLWTL